MLKDYLYNYDNGTLSVTDILIIITFQILKPALATIALLSISVYPDLVNFIGSTACLIVCIMAVRLMKGEMVW